MIDNPYYNTMDRYIELIRVAVADNLSAVERAMEWHPEDAMYQIEQANRAIGLVLSHLNHEYHYKKKEMNHGTTD